MKSRISSFAFSGATAADDTDSDEAATDSDEAATDSPEAATDSPDDVTD
jgi:hypothetical protein